MNLNKLIEGTFLEQIEAINPCNINYPVAENEEIIGEMTELEKRLYTISRKYERILNAIKEKLDKIKDDKDLEEKILNAGSSAYAIVTSTSDLMWALIRERIMFNPHEGWSIGVRDEYKIVEFYTEKNTPEAFMKLFKI